MVATAVVPMVTAVQGAVLTVTAAQAAMAVMLMEAQLSVAAAVQVSAQLAAQAA